MFGGSHVLPYEKIDGLKDAARLGVALHNCFADASKSRSILEMGFLSRLSCTMNKGIPALLNL
jgi:hypothetical protein